MTEQTRYGTWLRQERKRAGLTQKELASRIGVDSTYVAKIETHVVRLPRYELRQRIHAVLGTDERGLRNSGVDLDETFDSSGPEKDESTATPPIDPSDPLYNVVFWEMRKLTPEDLEAVRAIVRRLARED